MVSQQHPRALRRIPSPLGTSCTPVECAPGRVSATLLPQFYRVVELQVVGADVWGFGCWRCVSVRAVQRLPIPILLDLVHGTDDHVHPTRTRVAGDQHTPAAHVATSTHTGHTVHLKQQPSSETEPCSEFLSSQPGKPKQHNTSNGGSSQVGVVFPQAATYLYPWLLLHLEQTAMHIHFMYTAYG